MNNFSQENISVCMEVTAENRGRERKFPSEIKALLPVNGLHASDLRIFSTRHKEARLD